MGKVKCNVELKQLVSNFFNNPKIKDKSKTSLEIYLRKYKYNLEDFTKMVESLAP